MEQFGTKDLYKVVMRATHKMRVGNREVLEGEPLLHLAGAQIFSANRQSGFRAARGGKGNLAHVIWETSGDVAFSIQNGVISPVGLALLSGMELLDLPTDGTTILTHTEVMEVDDYGSAYLKYTPIIEEPIFIYLFENDVIQKKIDGGYRINGDVITFSEEYFGKQIFIDYSHYYGEKVLEYQLKNKYFNGYLSMEARYYTRAESGLEVTNILYVPKMSIVSNLSLRIGENVAGPTLSTFNIVALAEKIGDEYSIMKLRQLGEDVDGL